MKKRIMALILCISILCGLLPSDVYAVSPEVAGEKTTLSGNSAHSGENEESEEVEEAEVTEVNQLGYFNGTSVKLYYDLGTPEQYEELTSESDSWPVAFMVLSSMVYNEETWYILENDFTGNGATFVNSESVSLGTPEFEEYTGDGNIDDTAVFDTESYLNFVVTEDPTTYQHDLTSSGYISSLEPDDIFDLTAEENTFTMIITDYYWDSNSSALWYQVEAAEGSSLPEAMGDKNWVFQCYTHDAMQAGAANQLIITETVKDICDVCGKENCTDSLHFYCTVCEVYNCGLEHLYCNVCSDYDCDKTHVYCGICADYDCGLEHEEMNSPLTAPVIPENPVMTEGEDVSLVDEYGDPVTAEDGMILSEGTKVSLSAWSELENTSDVSWQWQICYDNEKDLWADIYGQTGKGILLSPAMIFSVTGESGYAPIRCVMTAGKETQTSAAIHLMLAPQAVAFKARKASVAPIDDATTPDELKKGYVVVQYVYEDGRTAAATTFAEIIPGSAYKHEYELPEIPGYRATLDSHAYEDAVKIEGNTLKLDFAAGTLTEEYTIFTVTYRPDFVDYTVIHYWQNVDNDNYKEYERVTISNTHKTGELIKDVHKSYPGFYNLLYETPTAAADGSTVLEVYYDRYYYLMTFDLGDMGYGVDPIYARYGTPVEIGTPTREGYTFLGWDLAVIDSDQDGKLDTGDGVAETAMPTTMPEENRKYVALWKTNETAKVSVVFWGENANDEGYSYLTTGVVEIKPGTQYTFSEGETVFLICGKEEHTHVTECGPKCGKEEHLIHTDECLGNCTHSEHTLACYSAGYWGLKETNKPDQINNVGGDGVYSYSYYGRQRYYLYLDGKWYCAKNWEEDDYDTTKIELSCEHTHTESCYTCEYHEHTIACYSCGKEEHSHTSDCNQNGSGLDSNLWKFVRSETKTVNAAGTTVINVYYDRVEYTFTYRVSRQTIHSFSAKWGSNIREKWTFTGTNGTRYSPENKDSWEGDVIYTQRIYMVEIMPSQNITFSRATGNTTSNNFYYYVESLENKAGENKRQFENLYYDYSFTLTNDFRTLYYDEDFFELEGFTKYKSARENGNEYPLSNSGTSPINNLYFYYTRHRYSIEFYNPTTLLKTETGIPFEAPLTSYGWTPDPSMAPEQYEPGSVAFDGWYLNPECTGDKFDFTVATMPAGTKSGDTTLTLYAKWELVSHKVNYYLTKDSLDRGETIPVEMNRLVDEAVAEGATTPTDDPYTEVFAEDIVQHGGYITGLANPGVTKGYEKIHPRAGYTFVGWFYINDEGKETAFDPENMPVDRDLNLYAKWSSNVLCKYNVYFALDGDKDGIADTDKNGNIIYIADAISGSGIAGHTFTFKAKGGEELYEKYQEGYFPTVGSHSMIIDITDEDGSDENKYTFLYQQKEAVPYTVYYLTDEQNEAGTLKSINLNGKTYYQVADIKSVGDNKNVVVTENFVYVAGYLPDKYQKTLVVSGAEGAENVIIFYYTEDTQHALYVVNHYIQELNSDLEHTGWSKYTDLQNIGDIGTEYTATALNIDGFTLSTKYTDQYNTEKKINGAENRNLPTEVSKLTENTLSGTLGAEGMELNFYYTRNLYPYEFRYMLNGTTTELAEPVFDKAAYDSLVTGAAKEIQMDIDGDGINEDYRLYDPTETSKDIHIKVDGEPLASDAVVTKSQAKVNVETFYYVRCTQTMTIKKQVVDNCSFSDPDSNQEFKMSLLIHAKSGYHQTSYKYTKSDGTSETSGTLSPVASAPNTLEFTLKHNETIKIEGLPTAEYTVSEVDLPVGYYDSYAPAQENKLTVDQQVDVTVTNRYEPSELKISKTVKAGGNYNIPSANNQEFTFTVTFDDGGTYNYTKGDTSGTLTSGGTLTLKHGETALFEKLPAGVTYTVKETAVDGFTADEETKTGTLVRNQSTEAAFTNTYTEKLGNLKITKKIVKEYENDVIPGGTFTFTVTGTTDARPGTYKATIGSQTREIKVGENGAIESFTVDVNVPENGNSNSITISNLPVGSYTVIETALAGYTCDTTAKETAVEENTTAEVTVTNTYPRTTGSLTINKKVINKSYDAINNKAFTFIVTMPNGVTIPDGGYVVENGKFEAIDNSNNQFKVTVTASAEAMKAGTVSSAIIRDLPSGDYTVEEAQLEPGYTADFGNGVIAATVQIRKSDEIVNCTNTYKPVSYIAVTKELKFAKNVTEPQKQAIISAYKENPVRFDLKDGNTVVATATASINEVGTFEAAKFMSVIVPSEVYFPVRGKTYTVEETSDHNVSGFYWTHADVTLTVDENIEDDVVYTNTYTRPEITITKNVSANDKDGNSLSDNEIKKLIETYGTNGVYKATFNLLDYGTKEEAGTLVISFEADKLTDEGNRTAKVKLNADYLAKHQNNADIKLIIQEDHTDGNTTIFGNDHPGVSFKSHAADASNNLSKETDTDQQPVYVITLTKENPDAQIICENVYPPVSYIAVQKKLEVKNDNAVIPEDIKEHYEKKPVVFTLYENYGETTQKEVAHAYPQFDETTGTFTEVTFVVDGSGNPFVPVYDTEYTIVETSLHRIGGYVWAKIGDTNSTVITVEASTTQPVVEKEFTNQYTPAAVGVEVEKKLVFYADETGTTGLTTVQIEALLEKSDSGDKTYKATFGLYIVPDETTTEVNEKCTKIGEATASFKIDDFKNDAYIATKTLKFTGIGDTDSADLDAYLKELGASTKQTHLLIHEDSASTIDGKPIDLEFEQTSFVLGGSDTDNQKYYNKATFENIYPPRLLTTSLKIVKEAEGDLKIPDGEQFIFKVQTTDNGVTSTRDVVLVWDNDEENSITINDVSLNTVVVVETGWGWRYDPTDDNGDGYPDIKKELTLTMDAASNVITFTNTLNEEQWLDTQTRVDNQFESVPESETTQ